jgi:hypothetical protein
MAGAGTRSKKKDKQTAASKPPAKKQTAPLPVDEATAAFDALREDLGDRAFDLLPEEVHEIRTLTFPYKTKMPDSNPEVTVWALLNALKGSTTKGLEAVDLDKVRVLPLSRTSPADHVLTRIRPHACCRSAPRRRRIRRKRSRT